MIGLTANVIIFLYNKFEPQGHVAIMYKKSNKLTALYLLHIASTVF